jgi:predicted ATPase
VKIEAIRLQNFKAFRKTEIRDIPSMCVIVGANGSGKSTFFDVFGFLKDAMTDNIQKALSKRGGFQEVRSRESHGPIEIEIKFRVPLSQDKRKPLITYLLSIDERDGHSYVDRETLRYRRGSKGQPWKFLDYSDGKGSAVTNELEDIDDESQLKREDQPLAKPDILAIKGLAQFQQFPAVMAFGQLIENWHVSDFHISSARKTQDDGYAEHLSKEGENLSLVTQYLHEHHPKTFQLILEKLKNRVPGINQVEAKTTEEGRILLKFQDGSFKDPFLSRYVSDGTIKMFAYLVLLHDPSPHPLLCVEEPENQLYPRLLGELAEEFRAYSERGGQVFVSTHSPDFLNAVELDEVFWLKKAKGYTTIERAKDQKRIIHLVKEGDKLGYLWNQGLFEGVDPK